MNLRPRPRREGRRGFSLIELLVVVALMGLALGMVVFGGAGLGPRASLSAGATQVASAVNLARSRAAATGLTHWVVYDIGERRLWIEARDPEDPVTRTAFADSELPDGVVFRDVETWQVHDTGEVEIEFTPLGSGAGHAVHLLLEGTDPSMECTVETHPLTGIVRVRDDYRPLQVPADPTGPEER